MKKVLLFALAPMLFTFAQAQFSIQNALIEEFSGAWCGYCVDGAVILDDILDTYPEAFGVTLHNGDDMTTPDGDQVLAYWVNQGYPEAMVDRTSKGISRNIWKTTTANRINGASSVTVAIEDLTWNDATREISITVKGTFTGPVNGDIRFNVYVAENKVTGTGTGYNQSNYYNGTAGHPMQGMGNPIVGYEHNHTVRAMLGGAWGSQSGIIPASVNLGQSYQETFTYTLPASYDENEVYLVAFVQQYGANQGDRQVLNSDQADLIDVSTALADEAQSEFISLYPNPAKTVSNISFSINKDADVKIEVITPMGQHVKTIQQGFLNSGVHTVKWNTSEMADGLYLVKITSDNQATTKPVIIQK